MRCIQVTPRIGTQNKKRIGVEEHQLRPTINWNFSFSDKFSMLKKQKINKKQNNKNAICFTCLITEKENK
jgi:hypothetical protein